MDQIATVRSAIRHPDRFFIGGRWVEPSSGKMISVVDSASEQPFLSVAEAQAADMSQAIAAARDAFDNGPWPRMSHAERAGYMRALAVALRKRGADIRELWPREAGALASLAQPYTDRAANEFDYYAGFADTYAFEEFHKPTAGEFGLLVREPVGVVGAIVPWNGPVVAISHKLAPALICGCTVVLKSSPEAPGEGLIYGEIAEEIGLPPGVFNVVTAHREVSEMLVTDTRVDKISFTGSTATGRRIGALCGERVARCSLELGGKSAAVILDDADIESAAEALARAECAINGQVCASLTRIIVSQHRHDAFVEALSASFSRVRVGDPYDPASEMGPLATKVQHDKVLGYIAKGIEQGARLVTGGQRPAMLDRGYYVEPTIFASVASNHVIAQEEIFGPVLSVMPARDEGEAVRIANDTIFGLNASVFTPDVDRARAVAAQLRSGTVGHNAFRIDFGIAFGGFKQSGIGREGGTEALAGYTEAKTIILDGRPASFKE
ncbi:aldehyde dehydrogenase [Sphingobium sp. H39-3-25]|uniref:aldehyde dehydrogenase n=1 Tax=Sphingobium arseniciresistens TaxID=3030834 RepID=UPI0023B9942A|nr:aldehyde dehydrogenase [Sphingobium arseniciresistens]